jgi:outer membrane protein OmpA-like peptidoglycan-associated protein
MRKATVAILSALLIGAFGATGCATQSAVDKAIAESESRTDTKIESVGGQVEDLQQRQTATESRVDEIGKTAQEALQRAQDAGLLAKGKIVMSETLSEDRVRFKLDSYDLTADGKSALDEFAGKVKSMEGGIFIEIQGHTDDTGSSEYNDKLGQQRAEAVRRYLARQHKMPLGRMSTISYGDSAPVSSNKNRAGRSQNRRVVLVVLE